MLGYPMDFIVYLGDNISHLISSTFPHKFHRTNWYNVRHKLNAECESHLKNQGN